jgi:putative hydrolase
MSDDLFSKLFELFNQPGPVNLRLAAEVSHHLVGDRQAVDPWAAEEFRELTRLAEFRIESVAPFPVVPAPDVLPVDAREWADRNLEGFGYLAEPFGGIIDGSAMGPAGAMFAQLAPAMIGAQLGTLVGSLAGWVMASFDAGVPVPGDGPITYVVPTIERFTSEHQFDPRDVRLWVALHEAAHRAMFRVPFTFDHLTDLVARLADKLKIDPSRMMEMIQGMDPTNPESSIDPTELSGLFESPESDAAQDALEGFLGLTTGYRRMLVERAGGTLLPRLAAMESARDAERRLGDAMDASAFAATFADTEAIARGTSFCEEIERRYGPEALDSIWTRPSRFPTDEELDDPIAWAARVLIEDLE